MPEPRSNSKILCKKRMKWCRPVIGVKPADLGELMGFFVLNSGRVNFGQINNDQPMSGAAFGVGAKTFTNTSLFKGKNSGTTFFGKFATSGGFKSFAVLYPTTPSVPTADFITTTISALIEKEMTVAVVAKNGSGDAGVVDAGNKGVDGRELRR